MKSSNPILTRKEFGRRGAPVAGAPLPVGAATAAGHQSAGRYAGFDAGAPAGAVPAEGRTMTLDDVVVRAAATLGTVAVAALLSWTLLPVDEVDVNRSYGIAVVSALVAFVLAIVQNVRRTAVPALIIGYAAFEGVFIGVLSNVTSTYVAPGVVVQAVLGTLAVSAGVLIAYRMRWIRVTARFSGFVLAAGAGFVLLMVVDSLFSAFGSGNGLGFDSGGLGIAFGIVGIILGASFLALDFKQIEEAEANGAPRDEAWLAAFGLTLTLVWIYLEALRVLTILRGDD
ncbi:Bax inhibitor-1/YccA family protein [Streptacidiphilus carbonis]|uniref:Bax inhibitor-1/YccA family protein n=1 Tax=Streptacidiphilus carbonis TaxID=105422 RepID=UPI0005A84E4B|nr:Bax inhibitor-1/YccA family protein [Streptacidiphilus carbonis]